MISEIPPAPAAPVLLAAPPETVELNKISVIAHSSYQSLSTYVMVAVEEAEPAPAPAAAVPVIEALPEEPVIEADEPALPEALDRTPMALRLGVMDAVLAMEERARWQYWVPKAMTVAASLAFGQASLAQSRTP